MKWIRIYEPSLIPRKYVEGVKGRDYSVAEFYDFQDFNRNNPCNLLFGYISPEDEVKGYIWAQVNALDSTMFINTLSVDKEFWFNGKVLDEAIEFLHKVQHRMEARKTYWCTTNKRFFLSKGFKTSKIWLMEFEPKLDSSNNTESNDTKEVNNGTS
jgi:hypothetical protein